MEYVKIGVTERGDGGIDLQWVDKLNLVDGAIIITKNLTDECIKALLSYREKLILHCTCTGMGGTIYEPNVPTYEYQLNQLERLLYLGFSPSHVVLRVDPIIPTKDCLRMTKSILRAFQFRQTANLLLSKVLRIRVSIVDAYPHVRDRFLVEGLQLPYGESFYPSRLAMNNVKAVLEEFPYTYETCAEPYYNNFQCIKRGCVSMEDLRILGLSIDGEFYENPQGRKGCTCLSRKTELLSARGRCKHKCLYCYWKD